MTTELREKIRTGEIVCDCWSRGIRPGFRIVGGELALDGVKEQAHFVECPWVNAVDQVYRQERKT